MLIKIIYLATFLSVLEFTSESDLLSILWPLPHYLSYNQNQQSVFHVHPCQINYKVISKSDTATQIVNQYLNKIFKCSQYSRNVIQLQILTLFINIKNPEVAPPLLTQNQAYQLSISDKKQWTLFAEYYTGFLRGFETFTQIFQTNNSKQYFIQGIPIQIKDKPQYQWRGLMIDSARHFIPISRIKHTIDGMFYNKMNILHWHIVQQDSFPVYIPKRPQLSQFGSLKGIYSQQDLRQIHQYALKRGIRIIPEYDSPAHTTSWGRSPQLEQIVLNCNNIYKGQFDPTNNLTFQVLEDVMAYFNSIFDDPYVHFGGDQVVQECWDKKPSIKQYMDSNNISDYVQLQVFYRKKQKQLFRQKISKDKTHIFWANQQINLPVDKQDVIQWWGQQSSLHKLSGTQSKLILSTYDQTYLDVGFGDKDGTDYRTYISWRQVYSLNPKDQRLQGIHVLGGEVCMWSEMVDQCNEDQKIWIRASALAERLWNTQIDQNIDLQNIATRLIAHKKRMKNRGFRPSPVTVGLCEKDPSICF